MSEEKVSAEKAALRQRFRAVRAGARAGVSAGIVARVLGLPEMASARTVLAFWPLVDRGEVDVRPLIAALAVRGVTVALPVVVPGPVPRLVARTYVPGALVAGRWGLMEPAADAPLVSVLDVVVVPALALGRDGSRLGYGGGYYDAFLATTSAVRVGVAPQACLVDALPAEPHDARMDAVVTEHETFRTAGSSRNAADPAP